MIEKYTTDEGINHHWASRTEPMSSGEDRSPKDSPRWTNDCQGKQDFDGSLVYVSTRYWPRGGGYALMGPTGYVTNADQSVKPSANTALYFMGKEIAERDFEGETEEEVKLLVQDWVNQWVKKIANALAEEKQ